MADIFLSYAGDDRPIARLLASALEQEGYTVWWDHNIPPGQSWAQVISREFRRARCVIVLWSKESASSEVVRTDAHDAVRQGNLLLVVTEPVEVPLELQRIEAADLTGWNGQPDHGGFRMVLDNVYRFVGKRREPDQAVEAVREGQARYEPAKPAARKHDIFVCYRRDDTAYVTGHISEYLANHFGAEKIFKDVDTIPLGIDYRQSVDDAVANCHILLVIIGDRWFGRREDETRRIDEERDLVRLEIESALKRAIPVIPVLIGGVNVPGEPELPESVGALAYRNGIKIRPDPDFKSDITRLIAGIEHPISLDSDLGLV